MPRLREYAETYRPLDDAIARNVAERFTADELTDRVARLEAAAAFTTASRLDQQVAADWRAILDARQRMDAAGMPAEEGEDNEAVA